VGQEPVVVQAVGGGTRNGVWSQATSDICGLSQSVREKTMGAAYGDAFLAALAVGDARPDDIDRWNPPASVINTRADLKALYDRQHAIFRGLYPATRTFL
jgi:xylulokinase